MRTTLHLIDRLAKITFWLALTFALVMASLPQPPALPGDPDDKLLHIIAFAVLAALAVPAYPKIRMWVLFIFLAMFGAAIELIQMIPSLGRSPSLMDWLADIAAVGCVFVILRPVRHRLIQR